MIPVVPGAQAGYQGGAVPPAEGFGPLSPDFDDPYYDPEEWERLPRRTSFAFRLGVISLIILLGGAFLYSRANAWLDSQIDPPGLQGDRLVLEVPSGATDSDVMRILADAGVISNSTVAQYWIRANEVGDFQAGDYEFRETARLMKPSQYYALDRCLPSLRGSRCPKDCGVAICAMSCSTILLSSIPSSSTRQ